MNIILLSGGTGKRLWPISKGIEAKQFLKVLKREDGSYESMLQHIYRQINKKDKKCNILISAAKEQEEVIYEQLGRNINLCLEPDKRDTLAAIFLSTMYMNQVMKISKKEVVVVCPVDAFVDEEYIDALFKINMVAQSNESNIALLGIEPTYACDKYGYILPRNKNEISEVNEFIEKPNVQMAKEYIKIGALWNAGVFAYKIEYVFRKIYELMGTIDCKKIYNNYNSIEKISFDYKIVEKEKKLQVLRFKGKWKDLGTWDRLVEEMPKDIMGKVICGENSNLHVINTLNIPIACIGTTDLIVCANEEGILILQKDYANDVKNVIEEMV